VRQITQEMFRGGIKVNSEVGRGTTFEVTLPIPVAAYAARPAPGLETQRPATQSVAGRMVQPIGYAVLAAPWPLPFANTLERPPVTASHRLREAMRSSSC